MSGWFSVKRGMLDHDLFKPDGKWSKAEAWIWMIENAAISEKTVDIGGKPHTVPRGSLAYSLRFLADKWSWSVKAVRTFLSTLENHGAVRLEVVGNEKGTGRTQITLCNYDKYQSPGHAKGTERAHDGHKEEQETNIPPSEGASAPVDPDKVMFDAGRRLLAASGKSAADAGRILGKWRRDHGTEAVISAIGRAQREGAIEPVSYIEGCLRFQRKEAEKPKRGDLKVTKDGRVREWDGWAWGYRNDLTPEDVAHAV